jgi:hypothetical protein
MSYEKNQRLIKKIEELERELGELKIELKYPTRNVKKSDRLKIGNKVEILNPGRHQDKKGIVIKANYSTDRATIKTENGKVSRIFRNLRKEQ